MDVLSARQFREWMTFYAVDPFGDQRADLRMGVLAAAMSNRWRGKNEEPMKPIDFMPFNRTEQTPNEIRSTLRRILGR
jgi:hypothetical protein